jgi:hypothetical protein
VAEQLLASQDGPGSMQLEDGLQLHVDTEFLESHSLPMYDADVDHTHILTVRHSLSNS